MSIRRILTEVEAGEFKFFGDRNYKKYSQQLKDDYPKFFQKMEIVYSMVNEEGGELENMVLIGENDWKFIALVVHNKLSDEDLRRYAEDFVDRDRFPIIDGNHYQVHTKHFLKSVHGTTNPESARKSVREHFKKFQDFIKNGEFDIDNNFLDYVRDKFGKTPNIAQK